MKQWILYRRWLAPILALYSVKDRTRLIFLIANAKRAVEMDSMLSALLQFRIESMTTNNQARAMKALFVVPSSPAHHQRTYSRVHHSLSRHKSKPRTRATYQSSNQLEVMDHKVAPICSWQACPILHHWRAARTNRCPQACLKCKYQSRIGRNGSHPLQVQIQIINDPL